ncbi:MAG: YceI family protein [Bdellovibrionota bacterium]
MKSFTQTFGVAALALAGSVSAFATSSIDASKSQVKWTGYGVGKSHWGYVNVKEADLKFDKKDEPTSGYIVVDLNTINNKDLEDKEYAAKLEGHLKGPDFFETDKYPTATYTADSIKKSKDGSYTVAGKIKIKDVEEAKTVVLKPVVEGDTTYLTGALKFDRTKHNVKYNSAKFFSLAKLGDKTIKDDVDLEIKLAVKK